MSRPQPPDDEEFLTPEQEPKALTPEQIAEEEEWRDTEFWLSQNEDLIADLLANSKLGLPIYPNGVGDCCLNRKPRRPRRTAAEIAAAKAEAAAAAEAEAAESGKTESSQR